MIAVLLLFFFEVTTIIFKRIKHRNIPCFDYISKLIISQMKIFLLSYGYPFIRLIRWIWIWMDEKKINEY